MTDTLEYPYKIKPLRAALAMLFFAAIAVLFVYEAKTNDRGMILFHVFTLGVDAATDFLWVMAALSAGFVLLGIIALLNAAATDDENKMLRLTDTEIQYPKGLFRKEMRIARFDDIKRVELQQVQSQRFLTMWLTDGKVSLADNMLPDKDAFAKVCAFVLARVKTPEV